MQGVAVGYGDSDFELLENLIRCYLEHFALDDALVLAQMYYDTAKTTGSLYLLAHCLLRSGRIEAIYSLLKVTGADASPSIRYLYAQACFQLEKLQEAEEILRSDNHAMLHVCFKNTEVEPFAHALLAKIFAESGRKDEAVKECHMGLELNVMSWNTFKKLCDLGAADVENVHTKLLNASKAARYANKKNTTRSTTKHGGKNLKLESQKGSPSKELDEKIACYPSKRSKTGVLSKKLAQSSTTRKRHEGGVETRSSSRLYSGASQDSENQSTIDIKEAKISTRSKTLTTGAVPRSLQDKQLRSMNRINELEMGRSQLITPTAKLIESSDELSDASAKVSEDILSHERPKRTRSGSQSGVLPLSSHDQNALRIRQQGGATLAGQSGLSSSGILTACTTRRTRRLRKIVSDMNCFTPLSNRAMPPSLYRLQECFSVWTPAFANVVECLSHIALLQAALSKYNTDKAIRLYSDMPAVWAKTALAREIIARVYLEKLDYAKARELLEGLHHEYPHRVSGMEILSTALWHEQDARRLSMLAIDLTDHARLSPESWCVAGNCFSVQKQHETAVECLERAVSLDNQFAYAYSLLGHELLDTEQLDKAAAAFRRALLLCPTDYRASFGLGLMHFKKEQLTLARVYLNRAVTINPNNSVLLCQLSIVEQSLHNNTLAMDLLQKALQISPRNAACRFYRARLLFEMHEYVQCCEELNDLKLYAHDEAQVFFLLGRVHKKLGNTHLSLLHFSWASEMDPRGEQSRNNLADAAPYDDEASPSE